jgi:urea transport system substrate-binding protein
MSRRQFLKLLGAAALAPAAAVLPFPARAAGPLKVGVLIPLSGPAGLFGPSSRDCATLGVEEVNAAGGVLGRKIEPIFADVGGPPADAVQAAQKLWRAEGVEAFIGMHDSAVRAALVGVFQGRVPYIYTPVYEGGECAKGTYVLGETPQQQLAPTIPWIAKSNKVDKWYLIGNDYNWPRLTNAAAKDYIKSAGGSVVGEEYLPFTVDNFDSNLAAIKSSGANGVLITLVGGASVGFNRAFASFGLAGGVTRLGSLIEENTLMGIGAGNSANLYSSAGYFRNIDTEAAKAFAAAYATRFGDKAATLNSLGESTYEGVKFLQALAAKAGSLDVKAMDAAAEGVSYTGPRGPVVMTKRHVTRDVYLATAKGAEFQVVETFKSVGSGATCG